MAVVCSTILYDMVHRRAAGRRHGRRSVRGRSRRASHKTKTHRKSSRKTGKRHKRLGGKRLLKKRIHSIEDWEYKVLSVQTPFLGFVNTDVDREFYVYPHLLGVTTGAQLNTSSTYPTAWVKLHHSVNSAGATAGLSSTVVAGAVKSEPLLIDYPSSMYPVAGTACQYVQQNTAGLGQFINVPALHDISALAAVTDANLTTFTTQFSRAYDRTHVFPFIYGQDTCPRMLCLSMIAGAGCYHTDNGTGAIHGASSLQLYKRDVFTGHGYMKFTGPLGPETTDFIKASSTHPRGGSATFICANQQDLESRTPNPGTDLDHIVGKFPRISASAVQIPVLKSSLVSDATQNYTIRNLTGDPATTAITSPWWTDVPLAQVGLNNNVNPFVGTSNATSIQAGSSLMQYLPNTKPRPHFWMHSASAKVTLTSVLCRVPVDVYAIMWLETPCEYQSGQTGDDDVTTPPSTTSCLSDAPLFDSVTGAAGMLYMDYFENPNSATYLYGDTPQPATVTQMARQMKKRHGIQVLEKKHCRLYPGNPDVAFFDTTLYRAAHPEGVSMNCSLKLHHKWKGKGLRVSYQPNSSGNPDGLYTYPMAWVPRVFTAYFTVTTKGSWRMNTTASMGGGAVGGLGRTGDLVVTAAETYSAGGPVLDDALTGSPVDPYCFPQFTMAHPDDNKIVVKATLPKKGIDFTFYTDAAAYQSGVATAAI